MNAAAVVIGAFVAALGAAGVAEPRLLLGIARYSVTPGGIWAAAALRVAIGVILLRAAARSRASRMLRILGWIAIVAGVLTAAARVDQVQAIVRWWLAQGPIGMRLWPGLALLFGAFIVWAAAPARRSA